jgi:hypothetical protein
MMNKELLILSFYVFVFVYFFNIVDTRHVKKNIVDTRSLYPIIINLLILFLARDSSLNFFIHIHIFYLHGTFVYFKFTISLKPYH